MGDPRQNWPDPTDESVLLIAFNNVLKRHPRPWTVEQDWAFNVNDASGDRVALCAMLKDAEYLIALAERIDGEIAEFVKDFEEELRADP